MKIPDLNDETLTRLRKEVFGPCTVIGECYSNAELKAYIEAYCKDHSYVQWLKLQLDVEKIQYERDAETFRWSADGPTEEQLAKYEDDKRKFLGPLKKRVFQYIAGEGLPKS